MRNLWSVSRGPGCQWSSLASVTAGRGKRDGLRRALSDTMASISSRYAMGGLGSSASWVLWLLAHLRMVSAQSLCAVRDSCRPAVALQMLLQQVASPKAPLNGETVRGGMGGSSVLVQSHLGLFARGLTSE